MKQDAKTAKIGKWARFVRRGQWRVRMRELPLPQRWALSALRFVSVVVQGFRRNQCSLHAASLTFFSLMALVPVLVLALALARTFGGADLAKAQIDAHLNEWMAQMEQSVTASSPAGAEHAAQDARAEVTRAFSAQVREISDKLYDQVNRISFGTLGGIGLVMLLWTVVGVLGKVESSFNQIWGVERPRVLVRKFADYLSVILILPFLITAVSSVPVAGMIADVMDKTMGGQVSESLKAVLHSRLLRTGIALTVGSATFAFLLGFMPNTRVKLGPALVGGLVTLVLFGGWLKLCAMAQVGIAKYSALYGGFAVLPILLMWMYTSWQIILLGSGIAYAAQNRDTYLQERFAADASFHARLLLAVALCAEAAHRAREKEGGPLEAEAFAQRHGVPCLLVRHVLDALIRNRVLAEMAEQPGAFLLYRCADTITVAEIARVLLDDGEPPEAFGLEGLGESAVAFDRKWLAMLDASLGETIANA